MQKKIETNELPVIQGYYLNNKTNLCEYCPKGTYSNSYGNTECVHVRKDTIPSVVYYFVLYWNLFKRKI